MVEENLQQQWILEFLLRQPVEDNVISRLISSFSPITRNHQIMTRLLLRRASSILQKYHTPQQTDYSVKRLLETLEMIAAINQFNPRFMILIEKAKSEVEKVANDASSCEDTRKLAFDSVRKFLTEATEELGLSYLESVVKTMCEEVQDNEVAGMSGDNDNQAEVGREGSGDPLDDNNPNISKTDVDCFEHNPSVTTKSNSVLAPEFRKIIEKGKETCQEMAPSTSKPALERVNEKFDEAHFPANALINDQECDIDAAGENLKGNDGKLSGDGFSKEDTHCSTDNSDLLRKKSYGVSTPEFQKVKEDLISSVLDLKAVVKDPLPDALRMAANLSAATEGVSNEQLAENENEVDMDMQDHTALKDCVNVQAKDGNIRCSAVDSRPSLMERNSTARTFEWEDDLESSRGSSERPRLPPPPPRRNVSPLKKKERINIIGRRRVKRWSALEEEVLRDAVKEYGRGKWQLILDNYGEIFEERTAVDLKDKWRNMTR